MEELNKLFPEEYTGDIYAAYHENTWMTYIYDQLPQLAEERMGS